MFISNEWLIEKEIMRKYLKTRLIDLVESMSKIQYKVNYANNNDLTDMLIQLQQAAIGIGETLEREQENYKNIVSSLEGYCELLYQLNISNNEINKQEIYIQMQQVLEQIRLDILSTVAEDKLKILIMPYKADMWTSLESIWRAAKADISCEVKVVPIPYYNVGDPNNLEFIYEGERFPEEVDIVSYEEYSIESEYPDITFIHNPYDNVNTLTRVPEKFYSKNLKKYTDKLVYSPYHTVGSFNPEVNGLMFFSPGILYSDYVIAQSEYAKKVYVNCGKNPSKVLAFGSPKIDAIVQNEKREESIHREWEEKLKGKKVFLLNTHLSYFQKVFHYKGSLDNHGVKFHQEILDAFLKHRDCALIWRPHPLLKSMVKTKFPQGLEFIRYFEEQILRADNGIVDESSNYYHAFHYSDALLSTWSSLINEYMVTGKPILIFQKRMDEKIEEESPIKRNINYFRFGEGGISFEQFRENVLNNIDPLRQRRMEIVQEAFPNLDGRAGERIYSFMKNLYKGED